MIIKKASLKLGKLAFVLFKMVELFPKEFHIVKKIPLKDQNQQL